MASFTSENETSVASALDRSAFLREAKALFPELREELNAQYGLLHLEMHAFCDFVQRLVDGRDEKKTLQAFQFAERLGRDGNNDLKNALAVSFLEHLNLNDAKVPRSWARALMPSSLAQQYASALEYHSRTSNRGTS
jgi:hypothetical protein